jgi:type II secretion system protein H
VETQRRDSGFTLVELAVVLAIIAILAALVVVGSRRGLRNANVDTVADEIVVRLAGLPAAALADGRDRVFVLVDRGSTPGSRARAFLLTAPPAGWKLAGFNPAAPGVEFDEVDLPRTTRLLPTGEVNPPAPLESVRLSDARMTSTCGGLPCFALRYGGDGEVRGEAPDGGDSGAPGYGFVLTDEEDMATASAAKRRAIVVGFPTGIVKNYVP